MKEMRTFLAFQSGSFKLSHRWSFNKIMTQTYSRKHWKRLASFSRVQVQGLHRNMWNAILLLDIIAHFPQSPPCSIVTMTLPFSLHFSILFTKSAWSVSTRVWLLGPWKINDKNVLLQKYIPLQYCTSLFCETIIILQVCHIFCPFHSYLFTYIEYFQFKIFQCLFLYRKKRHNKC